MYDYYTNFSCFNGTCPLLLEKEKYGGTNSTCDNYCGTGFRGCSTCYFEESELCEECVHGIIRSDEI